MGKREKIKELRGAGKMGQRERIKELRARDKLQT